MSIFDNSRTGRNYVSVTLDPRLRQKADVYLLGPVLPSLSSTGWLARRGDVLRYLVGRIDRHPNGRKPESHILSPLVSGTVEASCHTERGCVSLGDFCVVEALKQDSWRISNLPMKDDRTIANLIMEDCSELKRLKGKKP